MKLTKLLNKVFKEYKNIGPSDLVTKIGPELREDVIHYKNSIIVIVSEYNLTNTYIRRYFINMPKNLMGYHNPNYMEEEEGTDINTLIPCDSYVAANKRYTKKILKYIKKTSIEV